MKTFLKDNWFKLIIITVLIIIGFLYFKHIDTEKKNVVTKEASKEYAQYAYDCSQKAEKIDAKEQAENGRGRRTSTTSHFNEQDAKCYVYTEVYNLSGLSPHADELEYSRMVDAYENKTIFQCGAGTFSDVDGGCTDTGSVYDADFQQKHEKYFTQ